MFELRLCSAPAALAIHWIICDNFALILQYNAIKVKQLLLPLRTLQAPIKEVFHQYVPKTMDL